MLPNEIMERLKPIQTAILLVLASFVLNEANGFRTWKCSDGKCSKGIETDFEKSVSVEECKITCLEKAGLWPQPRGDSFIGNKTVEIGPEIKFNRDELPERVARLLGEAQKIFLDRMRLKSKMQEVKALSPNTVNVRLDIYDPSIDHLTTGTDESYTLSVKHEEPESSVEVRITANTFFGARHALETLNQLIIYDDLRKVYKMIDKVDIKDSPVFTYRGVLIDTARSYISVENIKTTLDIMSMYKLNTLHWHMTDTQSFPYVSKAYPELSQLGAYSEREVYPPETIEDIVNYARVRGIRVVPEFDAPAHVGEGWEAVDKNLITCFKWTPWQSYCVEPPCGQFDPTYEKLYDVLATIFREYTELFPSDLFHMGGDEVNIGCWNSTSKIVSWMMKNNYKLDKKGFHKLWALYQEKAYGKLKLTRVDPHPKPILWSSSLTDMDDVERYLSPEEYIIQIWTTKDDPVIKKLLRKKYKVIMSNYDELYLDCGGPNWVKESGQNWCDPYKGWQTLYRHSPMKIGKSAGLSEAAVPLQILGSEAAVWTEQIDDTTLQQRLWPRSAALAERLWTNPIPTDWIRIQSRLNYQREQIVALGPHAELPQPKWCYHNDGECS